MRVSQRQPVTVLTFDRVDSSGVDVPRTADLHRTDCGGITGDLGGGKVGGEGGWKGEGTGEWVKGGGVGGGGLYMPS